MVNEAKTETFTGVEAGEEGDQEVRIPEVSAQEVGFFLHEGYSGASGKVC